MRAGAPLPRGERLTVTLAWEPGLRAHRSALLTSGLPRSLARAQAAKAALNAVAFDASAGDTPSLYRALAVAPRAEAAGLGGVAAALFGGLAGELAAAAREAAALSDAHGVARDVTDRVRALLGDAMRGGAAE